jgi:hypothetical protein
MNNYKTRLENLIKEMHVSRVTNKFLGSIYNSHVSGKCLHGSNYA